MEKEMLIRLNFLLEFVSKGYKRQWITVLPCYPVTATLATNLNT